MVSVHVHNSRRIALQPITRGVVIPFWTAISLNRTIPFSKNKIGPIAKWFRTSYFVSEDHALRAREIRFLEF